MRIVIGEIETKKYHWAGEVKVNKPIELEFLFSPQKMRVAIVKDGKKDALVLLLK